MKSISPDNRDCFFPDLDVPYLLDLLTLSRFLLGLIWTHCAEITSTCVILSAGEVKLQLSHSHLYALTWLCGWCCSICCPKAASVLLSNLVWLLASRLDINASTVVIDNNMNYTLCSWDIISKPRAWCTSDNIGQNHLHWSERIMDERKWTGNKSS